MSTVALPMWYWTVQVFGMTAFLLVGLSVCSTVLWLWWTDRVIDAAQTRLVIGTMIVVDLICAAVLTYILLKGT